MKTFTTYAEKKAKQILNLLQGYTKGIRITAILILLLMGVSNAWADFQKGSFLYLDISSVTDWTKDGAQIVAIFYYSDNTSWCYETNSAYTPKNNLSNSTSTTKLDDSNMYRVKVPNANVKEMYFIRKNGNTVWNHSAKMTESSGNNCVKLSNWDNSSSWTTYTPNLYVVGNNWGGLPDWSTTDSKGKMTRDGNKYTITLNTDANAHEFKITYYDTWDNAIGHSNNVSCVNGTVANNNGNIKFDPYIAGNVTITHDVSTGKTVITCPGIPVTLDQRSGTGGTTSVTATYGSAMPAITKPTRTGYTFNGYYDATSGGTQYYKADGSSARTWNKTAATTLYAQWTPVNYTITYNTNGGSGTMTPTSYTIETATFNLPTPIKTGYTFDGWYTKSDFSDAKVTQIVKGTTGNKTFYAKWTANTYTVTLDPQNGESTNTVTATYGSAMPAITKPTRTGYTFNGYYDAISGGTQYYKADGSSARTWNKTAATTLYAQWTPVNYTITYNTNGGSGTMTPTSYTIETATFNLPTTSKTGYTFDGWYTKSDFSDTKVTQIVKGTTGDKIFYAKWTANKYTVTLQHSTIAGCGSGGTSLVTATYDAAMPTATMPTAANGYVFMGYFDGEQGAGTQYYDANGTSANVWDKAEDATLYAHFVKVEITAITLDKSTFEPVEAGGEGYVTATPTLEPTPTNDVIVCWRLLYNNGSEVAGHYAEVVSDRTVRFSIAGLAAGTYKIEATLRTGDDCESGEVLNTETVNFTIASNYTITVRYTCDGKEIQAASKVLAHVTEATEITAPDILGYTFEKWVLGDGVSSESTLTEKTIEFTAIYDGYLTAQYTKNTNIIYFYNTLGWEEVYVYFYNGAYWNDASGTGSNTGGTYQGYAQMKQIEGTNVWYVDATGKSTTYLVFGKEYQEKKEYFFDTSVSRRGDYTPTLPMFVPVADQTPTMLYSGKTAYYNKGYWMNYPEFPGYTLDLFNHWEHNDPARYIMYPYSENTIFPLKIQVEINNENVVDGVHKIWFRIHRNDGKNLGDYTTSNTISYTDPEEFIGSDDSSNKIEFRTNIAGVYTFILDYKDKGNNDYAYHIEVEYPTSDGDYRILYKDDTRATYKPSDTKKIEEPNAITSFFIRPNNSPELKIQPALYVSNDDVSWSTTSNDQIHLKPNSNWLGDNARFAAYFFNSSGNTWRDLTKNGDIYSCDKPSGYTSVIFARMNPETTENNFNNAWNQTITLPLTDDKNLYTLEEDVWRGKIYLKPNSNWTSYGARFAAYFFEKYNGNTTKEEWCSMYQDGDVYWCDIPAGCSQVIFCRMNPATSDNNFNEGVKWNQTHDLTVPSDGKLLYTVADGTWDKGGGTWSEYGSRWSAVANGEIINLSTALQSKLRELQSQPDSVYTIYLSQNDGEFTIEKVVPYSGNFYIRCDVLGGGWEDYKTNPENRMTYSAFSESNANSFGDKYSHYATKYCDEGENIKFVIANDYSPCISDTLAKDVAVNGLDPFDNLDENGTIKSNYQQNKANVRFMWYRKTNRVSRVYIGSAAEPGRHFLVLKSDQEIKDQDGNDLHGDGDNHSEHKAVFEDTQNWIYERTIKVQPNTRVKLYACYPMNNDNLTVAEKNAQYFRGAYDNNNPTWDDNNSIVILNEGEEWNTIRVIYDFKTNRLMGAWVPSGEITGGKDIAADVMIIRNHQEDATCITLTNDDSKLTSVKTVYGALRFNRWTLNNRDARMSGLEYCTEKINNQDTYSSSVTNEHHPVLSIGEQKSIYERAMYFISFPFDVHLSDVFGFGQYGTHWVISDYNGLRRAQRGYFAEDCINEDCTNWDYIWEPDTFVMKANVGYLLSLDLELMKYDDVDNFWKHNIENVELFFPSTTTLETIQKTSYTMPELGEKYQCKINHNTDGNSPNRDRRVKDSYWRCIGVPSFANYSGTLSDSESDITWKTDYTWKADESGFPFLYEWNTTDNSLMVQSTNNYPFRSTFAYLVQNGKEIQWSVVNTKPSSIIARQQTANQGEYAWKIALTRNDEVEDQTFMRMTNHEEVTADFDFGQDLSKEFNYGRSDIYSLIGYERAAANSMPCSNKTTVIPLGLAIETTDTYTIAMPEGMESIGVNLIDNQTGVHTNLSAGMEYTITLNAGTYENRFYIEISPIQNAPTDLEYTNESTRQESTRKVLIDEVLYIIRDGVIYDAQGHRL